MRGVELLKRARSRTGAVVENAGDQTLSGPRLTLHEHMGGLQTAIHRSQEGAHRRGAHHQSVGNLHLIEAVAKAGREVSRVGPSFHRVVQHRPAPQPSNPESTESPETSPGSR